MLRWDQDAWLVRNVKTEMRPIFELCSNPDPTAVSYFLFPEEFDFNFYNPFCQNLGGRVPMASSEENFHEVMDSLENIVKPDIHEKVGRRRRVITKRLNYLSVSARLRVVDDLGGGD